jgi:hypothetical protein
MKKIVINVTSVCIVFIIYALVYALFFYEIIRIPLPEPYNKLKLDKLWAAFAFAISTFSWQYVKKSIEYIISNYKKIKIDHFLNKFRKLKLVKQKKQIAATILTENTISINTQSKPLKKHRILKREIQYILILSGLYLFSYYALDYNLYAKRVNALEKLERIDYLNKKNSKIFYLWFYMKNRGNNIQFDKFIINYKNSITEKNELFHMDLDLTKETKIYNESNSHLLYLEVFNTLSSTNSLTVPFSEFNKALKIYKGYRDTILKHAKKLQKKKWVDRNSKVSEFEKLFNTKLDDNLENILNTKHFKYYDCQDFYGYFYPKTELSNEMDVDQINYDEQLNLCLEIKSCIDNVYILLQTEAKNYLNGWETFCIISFVILFILRYLYYLIKWTLN